MAGGFSEQDVDRPRPSLLPSTCSKSACNSAMSLLLCTWNLGCKNASDAPKDGDLTGRTHCFAFTLINPKMQKQGSGKGIFTLFTSSFPNGHFGLQVCLVSRRYAEHCGTMFRCSPKIPRWHALGDYDWLAKIFKEMPACDVVALGIQELHPSLLPKLLQKVQQAKHGEAQLSGIGLQCA